MFNNFAFVLTALFAIEVQVSHRYIMGVTASSKRDAVSLSHS